MTSVAHKSSDLVRPSRDSRPRAVVMTMGALHEGHRSLMRHARSVVGAAGEVVVTDFVNPTQFGAGEDFEAYPRTLAADIAACEAEGVDIVFAPDVTEVYGTTGTSDGGWEITVDPGQLGAELEGVHRPGHFRGMLTVVHALLGITQSDFALFGEKDYQQLTLIRAMVQSLRIPVEVVGSPTVRESDGLAMSSRNVYLSTDERERAAAIPRALHAAVAHSGSGAAAMEQAGLRELEGKVDVDYFEVRTPDLRRPAVNGPARILVAGQVGKTRLIDNMAAEVVGS
jgi:pantoate--beta-alanine ligase